jgi:hypothetical protein
MAVRAPKPDVSGTTTNPLNMKLSNSTVEEVPGEKPYIHTEKELRC